MPETQTTVFDTFIAALDAVIMQTWPEVVGQTFWDTQIERIDWINKVNQGQIDPPWCVVKITDAPAQDMGCLPMTALTVEILYISSIPDGVNRAEVNGQKPDILQWNLQQAMKMKTALYRSQTLGTISNDITFDTNAQQPANMSLIENKLTYQAISVTFTSISIIFG